MDGDVSGQKKFIAPIEKKKGDFWKKIMVAIPIIILIGGAFAMWNLSDKEDKKPENLIKVGNYDFYEMDEGLFATAITFGGKQIPVFFRLDPRDAGNITLDGAVVNQILESNNKFYITFNPNDEDISKLVVAAGEIARILSLYGIPIVTSYTEDSNPINQDIPLKTCNDVSENIDVILISTGGDTGITTKQGCVVINGETADDTILAADKLGMNLIGIQL